MTRGKYPTVDLNVSVYRLLSPLLVEYEASVSSLTSDLEKYRQQCKALQKHVDQVLSENDRLSSELEQHIVGNLAGLETPNLPADGELSAIENLESQLQLITQVSLISADSS